MKRYEQLKRINQGFDQVLDHLRSLRKNSALQSDQVRRFEALTAETRASINSYLLEAFAGMETNEASRLFRKRILRERREEEQ